MTAQNFMLVFLGSGIGGCFRFGISVWSQTIFRSVFPYGTLLVNFLACLVAAFFINKCAEQTLNDPLLRIFILSGFCGGFSTFSTFSLENAGLIQKGLWGHAVLYTTLSLISGILVFFLFNRPIARF